MVSATRLGCLSLRLLLLSLIGGAGVDLAAAQTPTLSPPVQSPAAPAGSSQDLPGDLTKIKAAILSAPAPVLTDNGAMRFYVTTTAPFPKFTDIVGSFDLRHGPTPYAGMLHNEFVQSTRPKDMYSSAGFTVGDVMRLAALSYVEGKAFELLRKGALALRDAKTAAEKKAIQAQIEKELAALRGDIR